MDENEVLKALREGFSAEGKKFLPLVYLRRVDEPEFGCEGRPEEGPIFDAVWGCTREGPFTCQVEDWKVLTYGLDDNTWIGIPEGETGLYVWSERKQRLWLIPENPIPV